MESYINNKKIIHTAVLKFVENSNEYESSEKYFKKLSSIMHKQNIERDPEEMKQFLQLIKSFSDHHHRGKYFIKRIITILQYYKVQIKQTMSNFELFHIFENNKLIVLSLLKNDIITISETICSEMMNKIDSSGERYCLFFYPEIKDCIGEEKMKDILKDSNIYENYEMKRQEGENDSYICSLIRHDSVEEFISYVNRINYPLSSQILPSVFETNSFLIDNNNTTLIEYSAFFGSIQIFLYLQMNNVELTPSLWLYAIHSQNPELIHILESNDVPPPNDNYVKCYIESIKCHHNNFADYIEYNFLDQNEKNSDEKEQIISYCIKYHNYYYFQSDTIFNYGFFYLCLYHYDRLVNLLMKTKEKIFESKIIQHSETFLDKEISLQTTIEKASQNNENEFIYFLLSKLNEIPKDLFRNNKYLKQIAIPLSMISISSSAFTGCSLLAEISIPSSVTSIGNFAFHGCTSLTKIIIPSSVTSIGNYSFYECSSLTQISIPSSVISIGYYSFAKCKSLVLISNLSSITSIKDSSFYDCTSLMQISIPSSVTSIESDAFFNCISLMQISIPSSVTSIGNSAFYNCKSLMNISIPSSVTSIKDHTFYNCTSIMQISIPSSVKSIGNFAFCNCISLVQVSIPSSVTSIGDGAFEKCKSLKKISIPFSVTSIGDIAFFGCSSLNQASIELSIIIHNTKHIIIFLFILLLLYILRKFLFEKK